MLNALFLYGLKMGVFGIALATEKKPSQILRSFIGRAKKFAEEFRMEG